VIALFLLLTGCSEIGSPSLVGTWAGDDPNGQYVNLVFGEDGSFDIVDETGGSVSEELGEEGLRLEYRIVPEVEPKQMYLRVLRESEVLDQIPFGVYKFEGGKLVVCDASGTQKTYWGMPVGSAEWEFPTSYTGRCASYTQNGKDLGVLDSLIRR
jgi:hypothetical protein